MVSSDYTIRDPWQIHNRAPVKLDTLLFNFNNITEVVTQQYYNIVYIFVRYKSNFQKHKYYMSMYEKIKFNLNKIFNINLFSPIFLFRESTNKIIKV